MGVGPVSSYVVTLPTDPPLLVGKWLNECGIEVRVVQACFVEQVPDMVPPGVHGILALGGNSCSSMASGSDHRTPQRGGALANEP